MSGSQKGTPRLTAPAFEHLIEGLNIAVEPVGNQPIGKARAYVVKMGDEQFVAESLVNAMKQILSALYVAAEPKRQAPDYDEHRQGSESSKVA